MLGKKKKGNSMLYAAIKDTKEQEMILSKEHKEKQINLIQRERKVKKKLVISVTALKHGVGCTYMAAGISNYLGRITRDKISVLGSGSSYLNSVLNEKVDSIYYPCNLSDVYSEYNNIIYDASIYAEADKELIERSDLKIMMCWYNEEYLKLLLTFIHSVKNIRSWIFIFNLVPDHQYRKLNQLMSDYEFVCLPCYDVTCFGKNEIMFFKSLLSN